MIIDRSTTIKALLDAQQEPVIEALVKLNKNFNKLKNPVLRKLLAKRVSIEDACRIAGCKVPDFLHSMAAIGFSLNEEEADLKTENSAKPILSERCLIVDFDVRPILAEDKDPLKEILEKVKGLRSNECLKIINSFEPTPLISLLQKKGFQAYSEIIDTDLVHTFFFRPAAAINNEDLPQPLKQAVERFGDVVVRFHDRFKIIDVRAMEAPQPMHTILAELAVLPQDWALFVNHKKVPVYLLPHLHDDGFEYLISQDEPDKVSLLIFKP